MLPGNILMNSPSSCQALVTADNPGPYYPVWWARAATIVIAPVKGGRSSNSLTAGNTIDSLAERNQVITAHTDVVGNLFRPSELLEAQRKLSRDDLTPAEFQRIEDRPVDEVLRL